MIRAILPYDDDGPTREFTLDLGRAHASDYLLERAGISRAAAFYMGLRMGGKSDYLENKLLDHTLRKTAFTQPGGVWLALCTVLPEDSKTGVTITEASYTGYARKEIAPATFTTAAAGESKNNAEIVFAECTAGSSTIVGWALTDNATKSLGNMLYWSSCTSTAISTTQTPPSVAAEVLVVKED